MRSPRERRAAANTGDLVPLFNPRTDRWSAHFQLQGAEIVPLTAVGRGTALVLRVNDEQRESLRTELFRHGRFSIPSSW